MTLSDKTELVLEVLRGAELPAVAEARKLPPRTLNRWVRSFLRAGIGALCREEGPGETPLAPVIPLFPERKRRGRGLRPGRRGGR